MQRENIATPHQDLWPGPNNDVRPDIDHQRVAQYLWDSRAEAILQRQRDMNAKLDKKRTARSTRKKRKTREENRKRRAASSSGPAAKRARLDFKAQARAEAQAEHERRYAIHQQNIWHGSQTLAKLQEEGAIAAKIREELVGHGDRISTLPAQAREHEENKIIVRVRSEHTAQQRRERANKERRMRELDEERRQQGLPPPFDLAPLSKGEEEHLVWEALGRAEEERRRQAERSKARQHAEKAHADAVRKEKEVAAALKKSTGASKAGLTTYSNAIAAAKAADAESLRQQLIVDRKRRVEQIRIKEEAMEARREVLRRAHLFTEKWGVRPAVGLKLDADGNLEPGQEGYESHKRAIHRGPKFRILSLQELQTMSKSQLLQYAQQWSLQKSATSGISGAREDTVDISTLSYQQQLALAKRQSREGLRTSTNFEDWEEETARQAIIQYLMNITGNIEKIKGLERKARGERVSSEDYARARGFGSADEYVEAVQNSTIPEDLPKITGHRDKLEDVLEVSRYWIRMDAIGRLNAKAKLEKRSTDDIAREMGHADTGAYLQSLADSIKMEHMPKVNAEDLPTEKGSIKKAGGIQKVIQAVLDLKWREFHDRIRGAGEWESQIEALPKPGKPGKPGEAEPQTDGEERTFAEV